MPQQKKKNTSCGYVKAIGFDALKNDSQSDDDVQGGSDVAPTYAAETPSTATPPPSSCGEPPAESMVESDDASEWAAAPSRRKLRAKRPALPTAQAELSSQLKCDKGEDDIAMADAEWFTRKGQRHTHTKAQKQEWNFKSKKRTSYAQQKRNEQRGDSLICHLAGLAQDDDF